MFLRCVILLGLVSGCAEVQNLKTAGRPLAAKAADEVLDSAVYFTCPAASVGAVSRRFDTTEKMDIWRAWCTLNNQIVQP